MLKISNLFANIGDVKILNGVDLEIEKGEILIDKCNVKLYENKFHFQNISYLSQNI